MARFPRRVVLVQLPIPPPGPGPIRGNIPLAAGYLKMFAGQMGLDEQFDLQILPSTDANELGDLGLVAAILRHEPWLVGFTCYLWNIERTLWIAQQLKRRCPELRIVLGGPEITADNAWVLQQTAIDYAVIGEGEQTFAELLRALLDRSQVESPIDGLFVRNQATTEASLPLLPQLPNFRRPLPNLDPISSPYLAGILDVADERMMLLETIRGCVFKCKFCYYPKSYDALYFLSQERLIANLELARSRGAEEVVLLDPTLNQRRDFDAFVQLLGDYNPDRQFSYFGELRAEGINAQTAALLHRANFQEVEIGLQSVDPRAGELMDRKYHPRAFEKGVRAMLDAGIQVKIDLIVGLPGDTMDSVRRGMEYLRESGLYTSVQVFNLAILPGTAFRHEAETLGLQFQPRPPYYVTQTPNFSLAQMLELVEESQDLFGIEFDPLPPPTLEPGNGRQAVGDWRIDLDDNLGNTLPPADCRASSFTLQLRAWDFHAQRETVSRLVADMLQDNPFTTLQLLLEPKGDPRTVSPELLSRITRACFANPTYLDKFYAVLPGPTKGAKRLIVLLDWEDRELLGEEWIEDTRQRASIVWRHAAIDEQKLAENEFVDRSSSTTGIGTTPPVVNGLR